MDLRRLTDFIILAAGVQKYSLINENPTEEDEYYLEHLGIVVEVQETSDYTFLLKRRPNITDLSSDDFDFDIINNSFEINDGEIEGNAIEGGGDGSTQKGAEDESEMQMSKQGQLEVDFRVMEKNGDSGVTIEEVTEEGEEEVTEEEEKEEEVEKDVEMEEEEMKKDEDVETDVEVENDKEMEIVEEVEKESYI